MTSPRCTNKSSRSAKCATKHRTAVVSTKKTRRRRHCINDATRSPSWLVVSPDVRISLALQTLSHCNAARLTLAQAELTLSKVGVPTIPDWRTLDHVVVDRESASSVVVVPEHTSTTTTPHRSGPPAHQAAPAASTTTLPVLSPAARALVAPEPSTTNFTVEHHCDNNNNNAAMQLGNILRRATITNPQTVQCMIDGLHQAQMALRELTPCRMTLAEFQSLLCTTTLDHHHHAGGCSNPDDKEKQQQQAKLLYLIVREALTQCEDLQDYYQNSPLLFHHEQRFSARTLPPFVDGYEDEPLLNELSDRYWELEAQIQSRHRQSSQPIQPGFTAEMVAILCHAYEVGREPSPIGLNLFRVDDQVAGA